LGEDGKLQYSIVVENGREGAENYAINIPSSSSEMKVKNPPINAPLISSKPVPNPFVIPGLKKMSIDSQLNPYYTFESFIEGDSNRLARTSGIAVANNPGKTAFNPLLIYGAVGLGKSHLIQAIGNETKKNFPEKIVLYVSMDKFMTQFVDSVKNHSVSDFISFYQLIDVLIVDDIQFLGGKEKTQDIFFHIFNHLHNNGKQIILSSDTNPSELRGLEDRLLSRFKWGLTTDLQLPDLETRIAILKHKLFVEGIDIEDDVVEYIAHHIKTSVRELEGAMISILAQSSFNRREINLDLARQIVKNFAQNAARELSIESIQKIVCEYFNIAIEKLSEKTRKREVVQARQIAMYYAKEYTKSSLKTIGLHFGGRDHSTVIHALHTVSDLMSTDRQFKHDVEEINRKIQMSTT